MNGDAFGGQNVVDDIGPLHGYDSPRVGQYFGQFVTHDARLVQTVKIKMVKRQTASSILITERKTGAVHQVGAAHTPRQAAHEGGLAAAQVADQINYLAATQPRPDSHGERQSSV